MIVAYYMISIWVEGGTPLSFAPGTATDGSTIYYNNLQSEFIDAAGNMITGGSVYGALGLTLRSPPMMSTERKDFPGQGGSSPAGSWRMISPPSCWSARTNSVISELGQHALWSPGLFVRYA
jgi:hypothetical protein